MSRLQRAERARQQLEASIRADQLRRVCNPPVVVDSPLPPDEMETTLVDDATMSAEVWRYMNVSGPVHIVWDSVYAGYRLTGPNVRERLAHAVQCAGERPLMESDIAPGPQMTATEVLESRRAFSAEQAERARRSAASFHEPIVNRALQTLGSLTTAQQAGLGRLPPGAINWLSTSAVALSLRSSEDPYNTEKVDRKAKAALWCYLNEQQRNDLFCLGRFVVKGGKSKMAYKIFKGSQGNVRREDDARFCLTHGDLPVWDLMLAQKLMIEDNEPKFLESANRLDIPF